MRPAFCLWPILASMASATQAQPLTDPMRPPAFDARGGGAESAQASRLQSTLLSHGRRLAIIDGQSVALGEKIGDATVVDITPTQVLLRRGSETEALELLPGAAKKVRPPTGSRMQEGNRK
jgi:MSHA biogenesis protein MshK